MKSMLESKITKELHRRIFELTLALYRVTDFFPQGEVLRKNLREKANEIFGGVTEYGYSPDFEREATSIIAKIHTIKGYLGLARSLRFVKPINITVLEREYDFLADFFNRELDVVKKATENKQEEIITPTQTTNNESQPVRESEKEELPTWEEFATKEDKGLTPISESINERQHKILEHLKQSQQAKISDFVPHFAGISTKTIQRDLQDLVIKDILRKEGEKRWTTYSINKNVQ